ncbi:MAG: LysM peptidoglycan-binding domain-containing protein [Aridibacter sp.]|jgi:nucleoid-associated protein YgaU|nr:LysM peptidoglycan-binding domain-containing protein [Acidobacteriota bacterium]
MLTDKYQPIIDLAQTLGVSGLNVNEGDDVLHIEGTAPSADAKQRLWDEYAKIDPDYRAGDLVLNIDNAQGDDSSTTYTVQSGDTLSKIGSNYDVSWQDIYEANRDKLDDPDKIFPGQELNIPQG